MTDTTSTNTEGTSSQNEEVPVSTPVVTGELVTATPVTWASLNLLIRAKSYAQLKTEFDKIVSKLEDFDGSSNASYEDTLDEFGSNSNLQYYITS